MRDLDPAYFAFVMATGIVSTGAYMLGPGWLSDALLIVAVAGLAVLTVALVWRLFMFRSSVAADLRAPDRVFGFFTITAGLNVLGVRFAAAGHPLVAAVLAVPAALAWLLLTYGVPASLLLARQRDSVLGGVDGSWLLWVVSTQSLSVVAAALVKSWPSQSSLLAPVAAAMWSIGLVLYLLLMSLIMLRWLTLPMTPATLGPPYWILMGATAITALAGATFLGLPAALRWSGGQGDGRVRRGLQLRAVGVRHVVDPAADHLRPVAARPAALAAQLRAGAVERRLPARHVQRGHAVVRQGRPAQLHGAASQVHVLGGGRAPGSRWPRLFRVPC